MDPLPCRNKACSSYKSAKYVSIIKQTSIEVVFGCRACHGIEVRVLDPRRGAQELKYQREGRPEYAREKAHFFQGKYNK